MSLTQDEYTPINPGQGGTVGKTADEIRVRTGNPFAQIDYALIIKAFEMEASNWQEEDYNKANHYRDVYSTRNFAERAREQMNYYPGMHQTSAVPGEDPIYTNAKENSELNMNYWDRAMSSPDSFLAGMRSRQEDFDYSKIIGTDTSAKEKAAEVGKMLAECVPCATRFPPLLPDGDLLEIHALNIKIRTDLLDKLNALFKDPGEFINICDLLKLLSGLCPRDILAMIALFSQYLAKLNLDFRFNLDFIIQLVGPILSPFLDALSGWLDLWMQLILNPMICVLDHINEVILTAQSIKIPFSEVSGDIEVDLGIAAPAHQNAAGNFQTSNRTGLADPSKTITDSELQPNASTWGSWQWEQFNTPDQEKYNPKIPVPPSEEIELAREEIVEAWSPSFSEAEREERNARWQELKEREEQKRRYIPPPLREERRDGTRWSKDDIPNSEKYKDGDSWESGYYPPEKQDRPLQGVEYFVTTPIVESIIQIRNILQGSIQYVKDWFTYVTQMVYDLLGADFGWMAKKVDNTILKSKLIQIIMILRSIISAIRNNGLECGIDNNFDQSQMRFILEEALSSFSQSEFQVLDSGEIVIKPPNSPEIPTDKPIDTPDNTSEDSIPADKTPNVNGLIPGEQIPESKQATIEQKVVKSGIIIKDCFRNVQQEELEVAKKWIADFERAGST